MIGCRTDIGLLAHSLKLNPLGFYFWALAQRRVYAAKPSIIAAEVIDVLKQFDSESSEDVLNGLAVNVREKNRLCLEVNGGPFQHVKKKHSKRYIG